MAHYTGPKGRINRRLGAVIFESGGAVRALQRRDSPPGMAPFARKTSTYGLAMKEKQKIKYYYGLGERPLRRLFQRAKKASGNTGDALLLLCERRLDSVIRLAGFASTRPQARQAVAHGHFLVNGKKCDVPSMIVRAGDVIQLKPRPNLKEVYRDRIEAFDAQPAAWLSANRESFEITVNRLPGVEDITLPVEVSIVVELLSR